MSKPPQPLLHGGTSPPPYGTSNHHGHIHHGPVVYVPHQPTLIAPGTTVVVVKDRSCSCRRFCRALTIAIVIWFCLVALLKSLVILTARGFGGRPHQWAIGPGSESPDYPIPPGIDLKTCDEPLSNGGPGQTSFEISSLSDTVLLLSGGSLLAGSVRVTTTSADTKSVKITVDLSTRWSREADTIVCSLERKNGERGVGIFNPLRPRGYRNSVKYDVLVEFPENHPLIKRFESNTVNAAQQIDDLQQKITFKEFSMHTSNAAIYSQSLYADWADIRTSNGRIEGYFNASDNLNLATSNGPIDVDVDFSQKHSSSAVLSLTTRNARIQASLKLHDSTPSKKDNSKFQVTSHTSNSPLDIDFQDAPVNSVLIYKGTTSNARADISLHPTFQGHFSLTSGSPWFNPVVNAHHPDDPSGKGRSRVFKYRNVRGTVDGDVYWGSDSDVGQGVANVRTSNGRVTLDL